MPSEANTRRVFHEQIAGLDNSEYTGHTPASARPTCSPASSTISGYSVLPTGGRSGSEFVTQTPAATPPPARSTPPGSAPAPPNPRRCAGRRPRSSARADSSTPGTSVRSTGAAPGDHILIGCPQPLATRTDRVNPASTGACTVGGIQGPGDERGQRRGRIWLATPLPQAGAQPEIGISRHGTLAGQPVRRSHLGPSTDGRR